MSSARPTYSVSRERGWWANRIIFLIADSAIHSPICWMFSAVILTFSLVILTWFWVFIFYTSRFSEQLRCSRAISAGSGEHRSGENHDHCEWDVQMSTRGIVFCEYTKKYCVGIKKKPSIATWLSRWLFRFSAIIFHLSGWQLRELCYTGHGRKAKIGEDYIRSVNTTWRSTNIRKNHWGRSCSGEWSRIFL